jgi:hypothetical protein
MSEFKSFLISDNTITGIVEDGITVDSTPGNLPKDIVGSKDLLIKKNNIEESGYYAMRLRDSSCEVSECKCNKNAQGGIGIYQITQSKQNQKIKIGCCILEENKGNGIVVYDVCGSEVLIDHCTIERNLEYGLFTKPYEPEKPSVTPENTNAKAGVNDSPKCSIELALGKISHNKKGGIYMLSTFIYVNETLVTQNEYYAINIPSELETTNLKISPKSKQTKTVVGTVGGTWGVFDLYLVKKPSCMSCTGCHVF